MDIKGAGNTGRQGIAVAPRLLDLSIHKNTEKTTINNHTSETGAMHKHMMALHFNALEFN